MPTTMLSHRDAARAPGDHDRLADPVEPVRQDHHVGGLRRGAGAARAHGDADVGRRQRRRIVDAVADHDGRMQPLLGAHRVDLVGGNAVGQDGIEIERGADRLRRRGAIAGHHDDPGDAGRAQHADGVRRLAAQFVGEQQRPDRPALDGDEDDQRRAPGGAPHGARRPFVGRPAGEDHVARAGAHALAVDDAVQARAHRFAHLRGASAAAGRGRARPPRWRRPATCCEACSSEAPRRSTSSGLSPGAASIERRRAPPTVSVPVLSNSTVCARASFSSGPPPLTRMPRRADLGDAGDEGDRRRQDERAGRGRDQDREAADEIAGDEPGHAGDRRASAAGTRARSGRRAARTGALAACAAVTSRTMPA